ncbi:hypothetical protein D9M72_275540 [compost metagenome]
MLIPDARVGAVERRHQRVADAGARQVPRLARVPFAPDLFHRLHGDPRVDGNHRHAAAAALERRQFDQIEHAGQLLHVVGRGFLQLAAQRRTHLHAGVDHLVRHHVDTEAGGAVDLGRGIKACRAGADEPVAARLLQLDPAWQTLARGCRGQFAEGGAASRRMHHLAGLRAARFGLDVPLLRSRRAQHHAGGGAGLAHRRPQVPDAGRAAGEHQAHLAHALAREPFGGAPGPPLIVRTEWQVGDHALDVVVQVVDGRRLDADLRPVGLHLLGQQHRRAGMHALPHLGLVHDNRDGVVGRHLDPAVQRELPVAHGQRLATRQALARRQPGPSDHQRTGSARTAEQEGSARQHGKTGGSIIIERPRAADGMAYIRSGSAAARIRTRGWRYRATLAPLPWAPSRVRHQDWLCNEAGH